MCYLNSFMLRCFRVGNMHFYSLFLVMVLLFGFQIAENPAHGQAADEQLAAQYFREGDFERAAALYEGLAEGDDSPVIYNNYLESLIKLQDFRKAERLVRSRIRQFPGQALFEVDLGRIFEASGNQRQARRQFDGLIESLPAEARSIIDLAGAFETRRMNERAIDAYLQGRRLLGSSTPFHLRLAALYERQGNFQAMMTEYVQYLELRPSEEEFVKGLLQDALSSDPDFAKNDALRNLLLQKTQASPDKALYAELLLWLSLQQKDFRMAFMQARALDRRFREDGRRVMEVAALSTSNQQYEVAAQAYRYVLDQGEENPMHMQAITGFLNVRFLAAVSAYEFDSQELLKVQLEYQQALARLGTNATTVQLIRNLARLQAFYLNETQEAAQLLEQVLLIPNVNNRVKAECQIELADIWVLTGKVWDAALLYAQVDKSFRDDPLAHEARFKNARLSFYIGEFDWAKAQLDVLKAATSRLIANDAMRLSLTIQDNIGFDGNIEPLLMFARAEKLRFMNRFDDALGVLDSLSSAYPLHNIIDDVIFVRAGIKLRRGQYEQADSLLNVIVERYPQGLLADEALFLRAGLHENYFRRPDKAMQLYQQLMLDYPGSLNVMNARNRFRALRGDLPN